MVSPRRHKLSAAAFGLQILLVTSCGPTGASDAPAAAAATPSPLIEPASPIPATGGPRPYQPPPCVYPDTATDLQDLRQSDMVVVGDVGAPMTFAGQPNLTYYTVTIVRVLEARVPVGDTVTFFHTGQTDRPVFGNGRYVLFLFSDLPPGAVDPTIGQRTYTWSLGRLGAFPVRDQHVYRECTGPEPNAVVSAVGKGQGELLTAFIDRLRSSPPPTS